MTFPAQLDNRTNPQLPVDGKDVSNAVPSGLRPSSERDQDAGRQYASQDLAKGQSEVESLTGEDARVKADDTPILDTYAPASERVAKQPTPGDRDYIEAHLDMTTAERVNGQDSTPR